MKIKVFVVFLQFVSEMSSNQAVFYRLRDARKYIRERYPKYFAQGRTGRIYGESYDRDELDYRESIRGVWIEPHWTEFPIELLKNRS
jgi:hypothetical protein